jgi:hypothetical protein
MLPLVLHMPSPAAVSVGRGNSRAGKEGSSSVQRPGLTDSGRSSMVQPTGAWQQLSSCTRQRAAARSAPVETESMSSAVDMHPYWCNLYSGACTTMLYGHQEAGTPSVFWSRCWSTACSNTFPTDPHTPSSQGRSCVTQPHQVFDHWLLPCVLQRHLRCGPSTVRLPSSLSRAQSRRSWQLASRYAARTCVMQAVLVG